jgi:peptidoglycan/LPS O-acetylase OafA/YrhL
MIQKNKLLELEAIRGMAALYVTPFLKFCISKKNTFFGLFFRFGQECVMAFFILSGFVIANSLNKNRYSFTVYFKSRFIRIYAIVLIAWLLSCVSSMLINGIPECFSMYYIKTVLGNICMLQDLSSLKPGVFIDPLFSNLPLWSLSYEWWFYMFFFLHFKMGIKYHFNFLKWNASALIVSIVGMLTYKLIYNQISLFMLYYYIWFSGALFIFDDKHKTIESRWLHTLIGYILLMVTYSFLFIDSHTIGEHGIFPMLMLRHLMVSVLLLSLSFIGYNYIYPIIRFNKIYGFFIKSFAFIGSFSFAIYVFHFPLKDMAVYYWSDKISGPVLLILLLVFTLLMSYWVEIKGYTRFKQCFSIK